MKKNIAFAAICLFAFLSIGGCSTPTETADVSLANATLDTAEGADSWPQDYKAFANEFLEARKTEDLSETVNYIHFEFEDLRVAYIEAGDQHITECVVEKMEKINDKLYGLTLSLKTDMFPDEFQTAYNFVGLIDGEKKYILSVRNIPEDIRDNLDPSKYVYNDPDYLADEDITILPIEGE